MTTICFELSAAIQQTGGISRYEAQLASALLDLAGPENYSFFYVSPKPLSPLGKLAPELATLPYRQYTSSNKGWRLKLLLGQIAHRASDAKVFPANITGPLLFHGMDYIAPPLKAPSVITVHDLSAILYPELHSLYNRWYLRLLLPLCLRKARRVIADSENTRKDLINWLGPAMADRIRTVPLGVSDKNYFEDLPAAQLQSELAKFGLAEKTFILSVGTIEPRKNLVRLVEAYSELVKGWNSEQVIPKLVLVGRIGWNDEYGRLKSSAQRAGLDFQENATAAKPGPQLLLFTEVADSALRAFYQGASLACYPSLYEGFGLPALEALAAGSPLITSNTSSLPEVTGADGETALLVDPTSTAQFTTALQTLLQDQGLAQRLKQAGRERARQFTWQRTALMTRQVYREIHPEKVD